MHDDHHAPESASIPDAPFANPFSGTLPDSVGLPQEAGTSASDGKTQPEESIGQQGSQAPEGTEGPSLSPVPEGQTAPFWERNPVTTIFSIALVIIYGLTSISNDFKAPATWVVKTFSFYPPLVAHGQLWRFLTASLLHGNPSHLFNNVVGLLIFGNLLESIIGSRRLIILYLASSVAGLLFSFFMLPQAATFGASTIDYGLIGTYLGLILLIRYRQDRRVFWGELRSAIAFVAIFVVWNSMESLTINMWGHLGGLCAGVLMAAALLKGRSGKSAKTQDGNGQG